MSDGSDHSPAELVKQATAQISTLVQAELRLARAELTGKARQAGAGVGLFGGGALTAMYGIAALLAAAVIGLARVVPDWAAALIVGAVLLVVAAAQFLLGRSRLRQATPTAPQQTIRSVRADIDAVTAAVGERNHR